MNYPHKKQYTSTNGYEHYLQPLKLENGICFLNLTKLKYISKYIKSSRALLDRNTYIIIKN